jgi:hypothetical protein
VSDGLIEHDGDEIVKKVPALFDFNRDLQLLGDQLASVIGAYPFAEGTNDPTLQAAQSTFQQLMDVFGQIYTALGDAVGLQGGRLNLVRQIGDDTEDGATASAGQWQASGGDATGGAAEGHGGKG